MEKMVRGVILQGIRVYFHSKKGNNRVYVDGEDCSVGGETDMPELKLKIVDEEGEVLFKQIVEGGSEEVIEWLNEEFFPMRAVVHIHDYPDDVPKVVIQRTEEGELWTGMCFFKGIVAFSKNCVYITFDMGLWFLEDVYTLGILKEGGVIQAMGIHIKPAGEYRAKEGEVEWDEKQSNRFELEEDRPSEVNAIYGEIFCEFDEDDEDWE